MSARGSTGRRSRLSEARGYHPRGRTVGDTVGDLLGETRAGAPPDRPALRLISGGQPGQPGQPGQSRRSGRRGRAGAPALAATRRPMPWPSLADPGRRLRTGTLVLLALLVVIAARLVELQVSSGAALTAQGLALRLETVDLPAPRGSIVDRNGAVLADSVEARYVFADPGLVIDPVTTADTLSRVLGVSRSELLPKLLPQLRPDGTAVRFQYLVRGVPVAVGERVSALNLAGIGVRRDESRIVPGRDLAANVIGFAGRDLTGLAGIEASQDEILRGLDGWRRFEIGQPDGGVSLDHEIPGGHHEQRLARPGSSLQLTIDRDLQYEVQRLLAAAVRPARASHAAAVVLDVHTGEVLALASYPFYDAADPLAHRPEDRGDVATGLTFEPGSVHKAIVFAACLQEAVVTPASSVLVGPSIVKGDTRYTDTRPHAVPTRMTLPGILAWSSNVGTITLADGLGAERLYEYQRRFGLGEPTGVGLPGESAGLVQPPENWSGSSHGSIPIGHGVSVTPLQMTAVYAAIANGGVWVQPHLVKSVIPPDGAATPAGSVRSRQVISADTAATLRTMLEAVVTVPGATGLAAAVEGYRVAGKTGTGSLVRDGRRVPGEVASFIGMAPADAPRYVVGVFAYSPAGSGGDLTAPAFARMMSFTLQHFRVAPTATKPPNFRVYP